MSHKILLLFLLGFVALALSAPATTEEELSPAAQDETKDEPLQEDDEQLTEAEETEKDDEEALQVSQGRTGEEDEETQEEPEDDSEGGTENDENPEVAENEVAEVEKDANVPEKRHYLYRRCHRVCRYRYHCLMKCVCKVKYYHCRLYRHRCVWRYKYYHGKRRRYRHCYRYCYGGIFRYRRVPCQG